MKERFDYRAKKWIFQQMSRYRSSDQLDRIANTEWDILVVLDACRVDTLREVAGWPVETAISPASCTPKWLTAVADCGTFDGTHIVAGNPQYAKVDAKIGQKSLDRCWESHWEDSLQTTLPEPMLETVTDAVEDASNGVVAHLQPPHWPYVAKLGNSWSLAYSDLGPWKTDGEKVVSVQVAMERGLIDINKARRAYKASVQSVWEVLCEYLSEWIHDGYRVIVTSDHGETFGRIREFGFYEHPCGCQIPPLVNVPWIELQPQINRTGSETVKNRLRALGYAE
jgi:hypothetical protein